MPLDYGVAAKIGREHADPAYRKSPIAMLEKCTKIVGGSAQFSEVDINAFLPCISYVVLTPQITPHVAILISRNSYVRLSSRKMSGPI